MACMVPEDPRFNVLGGGGGGGGGGGDGGGGGGVGVCAPGCVCEGEGPLSHTEARNLFSWNTPIPAALGCVGLLGALKMFEPEMRVLSVPKLAVSTPGWVNPGGSLRCLRGDLRPPTPAAFTIGARWTRPYTPTRAVDRELSEAAYGRQRRQAG